MVHRGILQIRGDLRKVQVVLPDHLLALLELDAADVFAGGDLQIFVEQGREIAGADVHLPGNQGHAQLLPDVGGNELLGLADDLVLRMDGVCGLELAASGGGDLPHQQEQQQIARDIPDLTPYDVKQFLDTADVSSLPIGPTKYQMSQICIYPDREAAAMAVKERLLSIRERIINGEKFSTLARLYSEDPGSARKGGELGMMSKSVFWPAFSDAAMALKPGTISQIVETPDGFHLIEVIDKKGDMFNARHILIKPKYTDDDREKAFKTLDSLRTAIVVDSVITFGTAARFYSQDPATRTNNGQMSDPITGSAYFEIDQLKPQDYEAIRDLEVGQVSEPIESLDNEGRNGNVVYKIIRLDKIVPSHTATFESDYTELLDMVSMEKRMAAIDSFLEKKIDSTYIVIDPLFGDCDFSRKGWAQKVRKED